MKRTLLTLICLSLFTTAFAQKFLPEIKKGTILNSTGYMNGQEFPLIFTINSLSQPLSIGWSVDGYGEGAFEMSDKALESATKMSGGSQPAQGVTKLADDQTFGLISKAAYKNLSENKTLTYNGVKYKVKTSDTNAMKINSKEADVTHVISEDGKLELWILNQPNLPLIVQTFGMPIDFAVTEIK